MKTHLIGIGLLTAVSIVASAQSRTATVGDTKVRGEIVRIEEEWHKALERADVEWLDRLLSDDWTITNGSGQIFSKKEVLGDLKEGRIKFESSIPSDIAIRLHGNAGVVTKISTDTTSYSGQPGGGRAQMTDVFAKEHGRWYCIASHASRLPANGGN